MKRSILQKVGKTPIVPISAKILALFVCLLLLSNFTTNYINIRMNQAQIIRLTNSMLVKQLKEMYTNAENQNEIFRFSHDFTSALESIRTAAGKSFEFPNSIAAGVRPDGSLLFLVGGDASRTHFSDKNALKELNDAKAAQIEEGSLYFTNETGKYLAVYKYLTDWDCFLIRAELVQDMYAESNRVFLVISIIIVLLTLMFMVSGMFMFSRLLRFINKITESLYSMQQKQEMQHIDLRGATNDNITYMGMTFNELSSTINNLLGIFRKFVTQDVVQRAYSEHTIKLEGQQSELTILFSDIRGFTYMTETLGNDIINLLNIHYDRAIHSIHEQNGIIGSIIGDALLAVYGTVQSKENKSLEALRSAWNITHVTEELRKIMLKRRVDIEKERPLTESEERVFKAVLIDVGVGIDGGTVFYGNIGSLERMTNTVIGDNVNSSSRLEGLTRIYHVPVIVSEYIKNEVEKVTKQYRFFELDTVQVKGKTEGKKIFYPLDTFHTSEEKNLQQFELFSEGLSAYYEGDWIQAKQKMRGCTLELTQVFLDRIETGKAPANWNGIWTMTTK